MIKLHYKRADIVSSAVNQMYIVIRKSHAVFVDHCLASSRKMNLDHSTEAINSVFLVPFKQVD